jgi:dihydropteroate synthase
MPRQRFEWRLRDSALLLGERTLLMGVLNVTPDSFSDGGRYDDPDRAYVRAMELEDEGADIIDVGAESTRPGCSRVSEAEELRRLIPVLKRLRDHVSIPLSVDTYKSGVARKAMELGVAIINDPSAFTFDPELARVAAQGDAGLVLNHMRGTPETWAKLPPLKDAVGAIATDLEACVHRATRSGVQRNRIVIDPGLGFGKRREQNTEILAQLSRLASLELPILVGPSRKSFLAQPSEMQTEMATAAAVTAAILGGAHIVRIHDIQAMKPVVQVADAVLSAAL